MDNMIKLINKILDYSKTPLILSVIIFLCSLFLLSIFKTAETQLNYLNNAMVIAEEMSESSDKLTNYARYYVTTKDERWKKSFENIIKIRNGEEFNKNNVKISFKDKVKSFEFSVSESNLILRSEELSNNLALLEVKAFDAINKGKAEMDWDVQQYHFTQAQMFMFGEEYSSYKNEIVKTIDKFTNDVYNRLDLEYQNSMKLAWILITIINLCLIVLVLSVQYHNKTLMESSTKSRKKTQK